MTDQNIEETSAWKVLRSEYLIKRPWLTARRDELELPDGRIVPEYYVLEYPDWVNVIAITKDGHFVMERQYRHALGCTCFELPCGVMEDGETPLEAAKRELAEETGYGTGEWKELMALSANPSTMTNLTHCFLATDVEKVSEQHLDPTEELSVHLLTREEVLHLLRNNEMMQSLMVAPLLKYLSKEL
ncbi:MAG: NUDIX hydrolase [Prevotella sp.]|nr:NUDIX hydrolase [Prevotella sp.]